MKTSKKSYIIILSSFLFILLATNTSIAEDDEREQTIQPSQVTWESEAVLSMTVSDDEKWIVYTKGDEKVSDLWLRSADPSVVVLPRKLTSDHFGKSSPRFSHDGRHLAWVGNSYDVKGDIYLLDLKKENARPLRLTGS